MSREPSFWQRISLTKRLVATLCVTVALALALSASFAYPLLRHSLEQQKKKELQGALERLTHSGPYDPGIGDNVTSPYYVASARNGKLKWRSPYPTQPDPKTLLNAGVDSKPTTLYVRSADGGDTKWLVEAMILDRGEDLDRVIYVATPLDEVDKTLRKYGLQLAGLSCLILPLAGLVGALAIRRSMQPLRDVEEVTTAFGKGDTTRRVVGPARTTEVGRVGTSVNLMLDQIDDELAARQASEDKMRRFVGDASHELRTPLAAVRGFAELYRMGAVKTTAEVSGTMRRIEDEARRMGGLVEDLLLLARMDEQRPMRLATVDLGRIARDATQDSHALAPDRTITLHGMDGGPPRDTALIGDEAHIRQVVTNLVANAIRHTPKGTPIELQVGNHEGQAIFRVVDHGHGIPEDQAHKVFERFFRADTSRSRASGGGSGLGLAIVGAITQAHYGKVAVSTTPGGGATFELSIPQTWQGTRDSPRASAGATWARPPT